MQSRSSSSCLPYPVARIERSEIRDYVARYTPGFALLNPGYNKHNTREECMRRRDFCLGLVAMPALARSAFAQEVSSFTLIKQHGLPYLPMMLMEEFRLVEKHATRLGVANLKTDYRTLGGTQSIIDALIGGQMHFGIAGVPGLTTLWDKTVG